MSDSTRSVLHEAMEQQTVRIAKAGIIATLHARTSILASANPTSSRYNPNQSVVDNIQLPPTLLSRFDLIYLVLDSPNVEHDRRLAQHLVGLYYETPSVVRPPLKQELLRDYIEYAKDHIHPYLSDEATKDLLTAYLQMRSMHGWRWLAYYFSHPSSIGIHDSSLGSIGKDALLRNHHERGRSGSYSLDSSSHAKAAETDTRTGRIDMDMIAMGKSSLDRQEQENMSIHIMELLSHRQGTRMAVRDVVQQFEEISNAGDELQHHDGVVNTLRSLEADGLVQFNERAQTGFFRFGVF